MGFLLKKMMMNIGYFTIGVSHLSDGQGFDY
jgi:hypothetical protein